MPSAVPVSVRPPEPLALRPCHGVVLSALARLGLSLFLAGSVLPAPLLPLLPVRAQDCGCNCGQPTLGTIGPDGTCQCPCAAEPIPGITPETLSGPPKPPSAGGPAPEWRVEPFDDGFADPWFGVW